MRFSAVLAFSTLFATPLAATHLPDESGLPAKPVMTQHGLLFTDNGGAGLYIHTNGTIRTLILAPGCGNSFVLSTDRSLVGLKLIDPLGRQTPAVLDLRSETVRRLSDPVSRSGQVSFTNDGRFAFTIGEELVVFDGRREERFNLGFYANQAPISPDGNFVAYNDADDQIWLLDLSNGARKKISDPRMGYFNPLWSPDSHKLLFSGLNGTLHVYDLSTATRFVLGEGFQPTWANDSQFLVFYRTEIIGDLLVNSDIYTSTFDGRSLRRLTNTPDVMEMDPSFDPENRRIVYHTSDRRTIEIAWFPPGDSGSAIQARVQESIPVPAGRLAELQQLPAVPEQSVQILDIPYIHQTYDTADWFNGNWACAPTQAMMLLAYYHILPRWQTVCSTPYRHFNDWGNYVSETYCYRGIQYVDQSADPNGRLAQGGFGYMWTGSYSPHSRMADYFRNHGLSATQSEGTPHSTAIAEISAGRPFSMCVMLTSAGHLVLAHGIGAEPHTLIFNDPYGNKNIGYKNYQGKNVSYDWPGYNNGFQNLTGVAWCIAAQYTAVAQSDTLVDDADLDRGFYLHTLPPSSMAFWKDANTGYQGHMWYALTRAQGSTDTCYGVWTPNLPVGGSYEVLVYIPNATATAATYLVTCSQETRSIVIDQNANKYSWVSLGTYNFDQGSSGSVRLGDESSVAGETLAFDAVRWSYRGSQATAIRPEGVLPKTWVLYQNFPNPFNPATNVRFYLPAAAAVRLDVLNSLGESVATLVDGTERDGFHEIRWDSRNISSGVYFLRMTVQGAGDGGTFVGTKTMLLLR